MSNAGYIAKGIFFLLLGSAVTFFPGFISMLFYFIGGIIIISCAVSILSSGGSGEISGPAFFGILLGVFICFIPRIISASIPIIAGVSFIILALNQFRKAADKSKSKDSRTLSIIGGVVLTALGVFLMINHYAANTIARIAVGVVLILMGLFDLLVARTIAQRNKNSVPDIIDVTNYNDRIE